MTEKRNIILAIIGDFSEVEKGEEMSGGRWWWW